MDTHAFQEHLDHEHKFSTLSTYLSEWVYGGTDGIVTTFAVVSGFSGASLGGQALPLSMMTVLLFGLANLFADGAAMGLGNFLSLNSAKRLYRTTYEQEWAETVKSEAFEIEETEFIFRDQGFSDKDAKVLTAIVAKNRPFWVKFMLQHECGLEDQESVSAVKNGLATFCSFLVFGFIPLVPYFFQVSAHHAFLWSILATIFALTTLGLLQSKVTKGSFWRSITETLLVGGLASCCAFAVGVLFK